MQSSAGGTASEYFGSMVESYDSLIRRAVPRYDEMLARLLDYLPPASESVLELGCGTGNLSLKLAEKFPQASLTFVDASPEMLAITRTRLAAEDATVLARARFVETTFENIDFAPGAFELVVSSISLHHVADKAALYAKINEALGAGGAFRFADQLRGATEAIHDVNWRRWLEFCREEGNCAEDEVQSLLDHAAAHDHYTPLAEHFKLLDAANFKKMDCVWRNLIWGIITADK